MNQLADIKGLVFNIQHCTMHDGPGIRTTVFVNGCPLRCEWCQNPESQSLQPQIFFNREKCTACGECIPVCPHRANTMVSGKLKIDRRLCMGCGDCTDICPNEARKRVGREMSADEVFKVVKKDAIFYAESGGGVTISGGEPILQAEFVTHILKRCKEADFHTAVDTCGYGQWEAFKKILAYTDLVLFDFKNLSVDAHKKQTGVSNELILKNAKKIIHELSLPMLARLPIILNYNDDVEHIEATAKFIAEELAPTIDVHLLPYHRLGESKYEQLDKKDHTITIHPPSEKEMNEIKKIVESYGLTTYIGG